MKLDYFALLLQKIIFQHDIIFVVNLTDLYIYFIDHKKQRHFLMFDKPTNLFHNNNGRHIQTSKQYTKKSESFRKNMRKKQINQKMKMMRQQLLLSLCDDYHFLKNINLNDLMEKLNTLNIQLVSDYLEGVENIASDMFVYAHSTEADHLFCFFTQKITDKLIQLVSISKLHIYSQNPKTYIKILCILARYTLQSSQLPNQYVEIIQKLFKDIANLTDFYPKKVQYLYFTHSQSKHILGILLTSVKFLMDSNENVIKFCSSDTGQLSFIEIILKEGWRIADYCRSNQIKESYIQTILMSMIQVFEKTLQYNNQSENIMYKIDSLNSKIANLLLQLLQILHKWQNQQELQHILIGAFRTFFIYQLIDYPEIILEHNFTIFYDIFVETSEKLMKINFQRFNYHNMLDIEGVVKKSQYSLKQQSEKLEITVNKYLQLFKVFFGLNYPQDQRTQDYQQIFLGWLQKLMPTFISIFKINDLQFDKIRQNILFILHDACLDQELCGLVIDQLSIMSKIFYYIHSPNSGIKLKRVSLSCLCSIMKITLNGYSEERCYILDLIKTNKIAEIFANHIGEYVDENLNQELLTSFYLYLKTQTTEKDQSSLLWIQFCHQGGQLRLQKYYQSTKNANLRNLIETILAEYSFQ